MKTINLSQISFYRKINIILNIAFIIMLVLTQIFGIFVFPKETIEKMNLKVLKNIKISLFIISNLCFFLFIVFFLKYFYFKFYNFFKKIKKDIFILFFSIFFALLINIISLLFTLIKFHPEIDRIKALKNFFFIIMPFSILTIFFGLSINFRIFIFWQSNN